VLCGVTSPGQCKLRIDDLQLHCCGVTGPQDWAASKYNKAGKGVLDLGVSSVLQIYSIPTSCCRDGIDENACKVAVQTGIGAQISNAIYSEVSICVVAQPCLNPLRMAAGMY
jgi:hypothetical protein